MHSLKDNSLTPFSYSDRLRIKLKKILDGRDLFAEEGIKHTGNTKVKRFDNPKVKCAPGSYSVKLPLKGDSLTPLSSDEALNIRSREVRLKLDVVQVKLDAAIAELKPTLKDDSLAPLSARLKLANLEAAKARLNMMKIFDDW